MNTTKLESHGAVAGQVERGVRPHAEMLARRLQQAAYSHGYEDGHPSNATTRQAKTDAVSRQTLADLLIAITALANGAPPRDPHRGGGSYEASMLRNLLARIHGDGGHYVEQHGMDKAIEDAEVKVVRWSAAKNEAETHELKAAQEADELRAAMRELVSLADMKARLENLHAMGHGTDWDSYHKRHPEAWAAARSLVLGPNVGGNRQ